MQRAGQQGNSLTADPEISTNSNYKLNSTSEKYTSKEFTMGHNELMMSLGPSDIYSNTVEL